MDTTVFKSRYYKHNSCCIFWTQLYTTVAWIIPLVGAENSLLCNINAVHRIVAGGVLWYCDFSTVAYVHCFELQWLSCNAQNAECENVWVIFWLTGNFLPDERLPGRQERVCCIFSRSNCTKSPASCSGNFQRPEADVTSCKSVRMCVCFDQRVCTVQPERWRCQYWSAYVAAAFAWLK